jgi:hypothetical protein
LYHRAVANGRKSGIIFLSACFTERGPFADEVLSSRRSAHRQAAQRIFLLEDQQAILAEILACADAERPDAVLIAGDVYDKPVPPAEAVSVFDAFVTALADKASKCLSSAATTILRTEWRSAPI